MNMPPVFTPVPGVFYNKCLFPNPESSVALCCLWTPLDKIKEPQSYAMIGPCVSPAGVDQIMRTLLANPQIKKLIVRGADSAGTATMIDKALLEPDSAEDELVAAGLRGMAVYRWDNLTHPDTIPPGTIEYRIHHDAVLVLPLPPPDPGESPTGRGWPGQRIVGTTLWDVWPRLIREVVSHGAVSDTSYGTQQKELLGVTWVFGVGPTLAAGVPDWIPAVKCLPPASLAGPDAPPEQRLNYYAVQHFLGTGPKLQDVEYVYRDRLSNTWDDQVERVVGMLTEAPEQRRGWLSTWDTGRDWYDGAVRDPAPSDIAKRNPPCLTGLWFRRDSDGSLFTYAVFRSHDLFKAGVSNAWGLCRLAEEVADSLGWPVGKLMISSLSGHTYSPDWEEARVLVKAYGRGVMEPDANRALLRVRRVVGAPSLAVDLLSPSGVVLQTIEGKSARSVETKVLRAGWVATISHAAWLGRELSRNETISE